MAKLNIDFQCYVVELCKLIDEYEKKNASITRFSPQQFYNNTFGRI